MRTHRGYRRCVRGLLFYSVSRVLLFIAIWLLVQFVSPLRGLTALVVALLVSGAISFFLLNRQRDTASASVVGLFRRIDERIERARRAEDADPTEPEPGPVTDPDDQSGPNANPEPRSTP